MDKEQILALAADTGAVAYSPPPLRVVRGYSFTYEELEDFYHAAIQHYKAELLKEVGEPVGYLRTTEKALVFMPLTHVKDGEYFFTESQLIAAVAKKDEEIERLKDEQFKRLEREAEKRMKLREQLATAEQRVAEACYRALDDAYGNEYQLKAIGEYRKYMKEV